MREAEGDTSHDCLTSAQRKKGKIVPGMVFHLNLRAGRSILRTLKTMPFLFQGYKNMYTAVQGVSGPKSKIRCQIFLLPTRMPWPGKSRTPRNCVPFEKKTRGGGRKKKKLIRFPFLGGKMDAASCFESIFPSKTL